MKYLKHALTYALALASPLYFGCATFQNNQSKVLASSDHAKVIDKNGDNIGDLIKVRHSYETEELEMQVQPDPKSLEDTLTIGEGIYKALSFGDIVESVFDEIGKEASREYERRVEKKSGPDNPHDFWLNLDNDKKKIINRIVQGD